MKPTLGEPVAAPPLRGNFDSDLRAARAATARCTRLRKERKRELKETYVKGSGSCY